MLMRKVRPAAATIFAAAMMLLPALAGATVVGGGGGRAKDCLAVLDAAVNHPPSRPRHIKCVDGDPCDADGTINGVCQFPVSVCANSTFDPSRCSLAGIDAITIDHAADVSGDPDFDADFLALQTRIDEDIGSTSDPDVCTMPASTISVRIKGPLGTMNRCRPGVKKLKLTTTSQVIDGRVHADRDRMRLICLPEEESGTGCDPMTLFGSTFERIQVQVFDESCALNGCHASQGTQANLVLETAYGAIVDVPPWTAAADVAGWLRVKRFNFDESFVYRKLICNNKTCDSGNGLPDPAFGFRMPRDRPRIHPHLREIIRLWIEAGAPDDNPVTPDGDPWVDGTY